MPFLCFCFTLIFPLFPLSLYHSTLFFPLFRHFSPTCFSITTPYFILIFLFLPIQFLYSTAVCFYFLWYILCRYFPHLFCPFLWSTLIFLIFFILLLCFTLISSSLVSSFFAQPLDFFHSILFLTSNLHFLFFLSSIIVLLLVLLLSLSASYHYFSPLASSPLFSLSLFLVRNYSLPPLLFVL